MQPMLNGLEGGVNLADDGKGIVYKVWGNTPALAENPITFECDEAVRMQVSIPRDSIGTIQRRIQGLVSAETQEGEAALRTILEDAGQVDDWLCLRDTERHGELTQNGLKLLRNFILKTPLK